MRKLKLQMQLSIDGFVAGPNGEMDWLNMSWSEDIINVVTKLTNEIDTILLGRNLAQGFIPHWKEALKTGEPGAKEMVQTPKVVFSKTLLDSPWENTKIANGNLIEEVIALKNKPGKDLMVYGGSKFVSSLIKQKLIDELYLFVNPSVIGSGMKIFGEVSEKQDYKLTQSKQFDCGIILLNYNLI